MTLREALAGRQAQRATTANRARQTRVETRADEIATVAEVETDYQRVDRAGDLEIESWFQRHYAAQTTVEGEREVAEGFAIWQRSERREDVAVGGSVNGALTTLKQNNPFWLGEQS